MTDDGTWNETAWILRLSCLKNKTPLRRRDFRTSLDANPAVNAKGEVIKRGPGNETSVDLFSATFDGSKAVDLTAKWVEFRAEAGDQIHCELSLLTKDNPFDSLGTAGTWDVVSTRIADGTAMTRPTTVDPKGKYRFKLPFTTEFRAD